MGNHNLVAESVFGTSQNMGLGAVWRVPGRMSWWCPDSVLGEWVWSGWVWEGTVGYLGVPRRCLRGQAEVWGLPGGV